MPQHWYNPFTATKDTHPISKHSYSPFTNTFNDMLTKVWDEITYLFQNPQRFQRWNFEMDK